MSEYHPSTWTLLDLLVVARLVCATHPVKTRKKQFIKYTKHINPALGRVLQYIIAAKSHEAMIDKYAVALQTLYRALCDESVTHNPRAIAVAETGDQWYTVEADFLIDEIEWFRQHEDQVVKQIMDTLYQETGAMGCSVFTLIDRGWSGKEWTMRMGVPT